MLGNDLIDLQKAAIDSNWERKGYLAKVFSEDEQYQILNSANPAQLVWLFWSMKEAAYKIVNRETHKRFYQPKLFNCVIDGEAKNGKGEVHFRDKHYPTQSSITNTRIHTIALADVARFQAVEVIHLPNKDSYLTIFNHSSKQYTLSKNKYGIPELIHKESGEKHMTSISHHGRFLAIALFKTVNC